MTPTEKYPILSLKVLRAAVLKIFPKQYQIYLFIF